MVDRTKDSPEGSDPRRESGEPGGGQGRIDQVGRTGVWPGSGPWPESNVPIQQPGSFGQTDRGPEGYSDSGDSSLEAFFAIARLHQNEKGRTVFVNEIMTKGVECIGVDSNLEDAARKMRQFDVGTLPVCGPTDRLEGMITDRDIVVRAVADGRAPNATKVRDVMTPGIVYCFDDQDIYDAARVMEQHKVRRIVVLNHEKRLVGIVSLGDLAVKAGNDSLAAEAVEALSEPIHH